MLTRSVVSWNRLENSGIVSRVQCQQGAMSAGSSSSYGKGERTSRGDSVDRRPVQVVVCRHRLGVSVSDR